MVPLATSENLNPTTEQPPQPLDPQQERDAEIAKAREAQAKRDQDLRDKRQAEADAKLQQTKEVDVKLVRETRVSVNGKEYVFPANRWVRVPRAAFEQIHVVWGAPPRSEQNEYADAEDSGKLGDDLKSAEKPEPPSLDEDKSK